jgi:hypothetical protein
MDVDEVLRSVSTCTAITAWLPVYLFFFDFVVSDADQHSTFEQVLEQMSIKPYPFFSLSDYAISVHGDPLAYSYRHSLFDDRDPCR